VASYGQISHIAGSPRGARQVSRILHSCSAKYNLPWHRVIAGDGSISLPPGGGKEEQISLLEAEGVQLNKVGKVDFNIYGAFS